jgi:hypothetical protein
VMYSLEIKNNPNEFSDDYLNLVKVKAQTSRHPVVNFNNILRELLCRYSFAKKITKPS